MNLLIPTAALKFYSLVCLVSHLGHLCAAERDLSDPHACGCAKALAMTEKPIHYNFGHV